jgi:hypothetical protein
MEIKMEGQVMEAAVETGVEAARLCKDGSVDLRQYNSGRPENTGVFDDKWGIIEGLRLIADKNGFYHYADRGAAVSRVLTLQLVERGYVETHEAKVTEGPGRKKKFYRLTGKGRSYLALSKNWKQQ